MILARLGPTALESNSVTLVLETLRSDEALDLGGFGVGFLAFAFGLDFSADDEFADYVISMSVALPRALMGQKEEGCRGSEGERGRTIIFFAETEEFADLGGTLGTEAFGVDLVH